MKKTAIVLAAIIPLAGCATIRDEIIKARDFLADPQTVQALAVAKGWAQIVSCGVANAATAAAKIEAAVGSNQAIQDHTGKVYTASKAVCAALGGTVTDTQPVN